MGYDSVNQWNGLNNYLYTWQIYLKSFFHVNKQCLLHEKRYRTSKAHDKKVKFTQQ